MKKFLAIVLALTFVLSFGAISFAAAEEVTATKADGTAISKPVSEVVKSVEDGLAALDAEKAEALKAFFAEAEAKEDATVIAKGIVDFAGAFADATEAEIEVPLAVPGVKAGDKVGVSLSTGSSKTVEATEDGSVTVAFPKDADGIGYVVSSEKEKTWDWPLPPEPEDSWWEKEEPVYDANGNQIGIDYSNADGVTGSVRFDENGNVISEEFNDPNTGEKHSYTAKYDEEGNLVESHSSGTTTVIETGEPITYENSFERKEDGTTVETQTSTVTTPNGDETYSRTTTTNPDGSSVVEETFNDGTTKTTYYDADGNEVTPSGSPVVEG